MCKLRHYPGGKIGGELLVPAGRGKEEEEEEEEEPLKRSLEKGKLVSSFWVRGKQKQDIELRIPLLMKIPGGENLYIIKTMGSNPSIPSSCLLFFFLLFLGLASPATISNGVFHSEGGAAARTLLQAKKSCTVGFENQNYSILVTKCKGPQYPANLCCAAFKQFACPFADQINNLTTDCASTMFSYINLHGKYPPGLFANECREGKEGLDCSGVPTAAPSQKNTVANSGTRDFATTKSLGLVAVLSFVVLMLL